MNSYERLKAWQKKNPDKIREYSRRYRAKTLDQNRRLRVAVLTFLGGKCVNPNCRWLNEDGTLGCTDERLLHIDHPKGGGHKERVRLGISSFHRKVLMSKPGEYRILCAQCNWLHRYEDF